MATARLPSTLTTSVLNTRRADTPIAVAASAPYEPPSALCWYGWMECAIPSLVNSRVARVPPAATAGMVAAHGPYGLRLWPTAVACGCGLRLRPAAVAYGCGLR